MSTETIILGLLIATALAFDFTNGFHDTGNAMATSIATGALRPELGQGLFYPADESLGTALSP